MGKAAFRRRNYHLPAAFSDKNIAAEKSKRHEEADRERAGEINATRMAFQIERRQFLQVSMAVPTAPPRKIRAGVTPYPTMSSFYLAHELGYFTDAGLDVEIEPFNASFQIVPLLAAGKIDVTFAAQSPALINAIARGARLRIVAARAIFSPTCGDSGHIYGRRDRFPHGLGDLTTLKGKRVAFGRRAAINEFVLDMILRYAGLRSADIQAVER